MQAGCGASYAFATTGTLESAFALTYDTTTRKLSEQNIIDCSGMLCVSYHVKEALTPCFAVPEGNNGCQGGNMYNSYTYIIFNDGIDIDAAYKYQATVNETS